MYISYDASGSPMSITQGSDTYYYVTNVQGDVIAILNSSGTAVVEYAYDAWGNIVSTTGSKATTLGKWNPLRYRSYVYDEEYGLYYLQSRYYNPETGRFINADALASTGQGILGNNMFAYCTNNPVVFIDKSGHAKVGVLQREQIASAGGDALISLGLLALIEAGIALAKKQGNNKGKGKTQPKKPDVKYPGNDPSKSPGDDYEWRGKPPEGGDKGAWVNKNTGEQWHPDLNHKPPKGPHWDYTDIWGFVWSVFENGQIIIW